jgi:prepilin-type N-terminal cleavage/methylation domain-containing protein
MSLPIKRSLRGFTLVELIMVMVVLAGVMAIAAPSLNKFFRNSALNDEARRIVGLIEMARHEAISSGYPMQVWFDLENQWFGMRELSGMGNQPDNSTGGQVQRGKHVYQINTHLEIELDTSTMVSQAFPCIVYFPDGQLETSSLPGFYLKNKKQGNQRLQIVRSPSWLRYEIRKNDEMLLIQNETL